MFIGEAATLGSLACPATEICFVKTYFYLKIIREKWVEITPKPDISEGKEVKNELLTHTKINK